MGSEADPQQILSPGDVDRFHSLETTIRSGLKTFIEVGEALAEIRDARLYRQEFPTFEQYCAERWKMSKRHCDRLIASSATARNLGPIGPTPQSESQLRPLASLPAEQQPEAWKRAVEQAGGAAPTAAQVAAAAEEVAPDSETVAQFKDLWDTASKADRSKIARHLWTHWTDDERDKWTSWVDTHTQAQERESLQELAAR